MMASIILRRYDRNTRTFVDEPLIAIRSYELPKEADKPLLDRRPLSAAQRAKNKRTRMRRLSHP
jgi:hypothetical protein